MSSLILLIYADADVNGAIERLEAQIVLVLQAIATPPALSIQSIRQ